VLNTVNSTDVKEIKQVKNTLTTCYDITTQTPEGEKIVTVAVDNSNTKDITLVDVVESKPIGLPAPK
jgi:lipopolysaccharide biosynthesis regulator YciM